MLSPHLVAWYHNSNCHQSNGNWLRFYGWGRLNIGGVLFSISRRVKWVSCSGVEILIKGISNLHPLLATYFISSTSPNGHTYAHMYVTYLYGADPHANKPTPPSWLTPAEYPSWQDIVLDSLPSTEFVLLCVGRGCDRCCIVQSRLITIDRICIVMCRKRMR